MGAQTLILPDRQFGHLILSGQHFLGCSLDNNGAATVYHTPLEGVGSHTFTGSDADEIRRNAERMAQEANPAPTGILVYLAYHAGQTMAGGAGGGRRHG